MSSSASIPLGSSTCGANADADATRRGPTSSMPTTSPSASLVTNTRSITRISPTLTSSPRAGAISPVNWLPGKPDHQDLDRSDVMLVSCAPRGLCCVDRCTLAGSSGRHWSCGRLHPIGDPGDAWTARAERAAVGAQRRVVAARVHRPAPTPSTRTRSSRCRAPPRRRAPRARRRLRRGPGRPPSRRGSGSTSSASIPRRHAGRGRARARRRPQLRPGPRRGAAVPDSGVRRRAPVPRARARRRVRDRDRRGRPRARTRRTLRPGALPPAAAGARQRLDRRPDRRRALLAGRARTSDDDAVVDEVAPGVDLLFIHRPLQPLRARDGRGRAADRRHGGAARRRRVSSPTRGTTRKPSRSPACSSCAREGARVRRAR